MRRGGAVVYEHVSKRDPMTSRALNERGSTPCRRLSLMSRGLPWCYEGTREAVVLLRRPLARNAVRARVGSHISEPHA
jgi:hypothetical protein